MSCVSALNNMVGMMGSMAEIGGGFGGLAISVKPHAKGTVGNAFAKGTKYKGLANREENALVSEYGQPEMTVLPNGKAILTDEPTMMDLPKGTVIFNEGQTKQIMDGKADAGTGVGVNAYASGTDDNDSREFQPGDRLWELMQWCKQDMEGILKSEQKIALTVHEMQKQINDGIMGDINNTSNNISNIVNNSNKNVQPVVHQNITLECPNVTNNSGVEYLQKQLGHLSQRATQEAYKR